MFTQMGTAENKSQISERTVENQRKMAVNIPISTESIVTDINDKTLFTHTVCITMVPGEAK